jgi:hypothetical protein
MRGPSHRVGREHQSGGGGNSGFRHEALQTHWELCRIGSQLQKRPSGPAVANRHGVLDGSEDSPADRRLASTCDAMVFEGAAI